MALPNHLAARANTTKDKLIFGEDSGAGGIQPAASILLPYGSTMQLEAKKRLGNI
ncbi:hypothetical protein J2X65_002775 [Ancylobacter sp. 3268]|uniref:hypothetical protein n=1 Tax=Ancylobacter sp. 3268 TaxID=2817752 RepID=UPI002858797A|nr:hypothetical protein [Ancylobacter sp. 3268]MDR6953414.1 hypothetical protein [Ancylobacter sp. 3268]